MNYPIPVVGRLRRGQVGSYVDFWHEDNRLRLSPRDWPGPPVVGPQCANRPMEVGYANPFFRFRFNGGYQGVTPENLYQFGGTQNTAYPSSYRIPYSPLATWKNPLYGRGR